MSRTNDPDGIRRRIVEAAFELFTTGGYTATPMHSVRDRAGISSGALAHHFKTKHDLGLAVIRGPVAKAIAETWVHPVREALNVAEGVKSVFGETIAGIDQSGTVQGCPLGNLAAELASHNQVFRSEMQTIFGQWTDAIAAKAQSTASDGGKSNEDQKELASLVVATFSGAIIMAKATQSSAPLRDCWKQLQPLLGA